MTTTYGGDTEAGRRLRHGRRMRRGGAGPRWLGAFGVVGASAAVAAPTVGGVALARPVPPPRIPGQPRTATGRSGDHPSQPGPRTAGRMPARPAADGRRVAVR
jgi:hypothetical protein